MIHRVEYPRPHFVRPNWLTLNGEWGFQFDNDNRGLQEEWFKRNAFNSKIIVPFPYQSELSGIHSKEYHPVVWYGRSFHIPQDWVNKRVLLNFNAVDYRSTVWVNGLFVGMNQGGYAAFSFDITDYLSDGENTITVRVEDYMTTTQPRGKQTARTDSWACWYTPVTGIWQSVWLEAVGHTYLHHVKLEPNIDINTVDVQYWLNQLHGPVEIRCRVSYKGHEVSTTTVPVDLRYYRFSDITPRLEGSFTLSIPEAELWSPESPNLYDLEFEVRQGDALLDTVSTYVGMRKISVEDGQVYLNNAPYYLRMVLDQGFWPEGIYTPAAVEDIKHDVKMTKEFGFNGARKHQKFEDPYYYYYCDKLGLLTWCEMAAAYYYDEEVSLNITHEWQRLVVEYYNHPSVMAWVPINESWGVDQLTHGSSDPRLVHHMSTLYHLTKSIDPTRLVVGNDGWQQGLTDIAAIHDYTQDPADLQNRYARFKADRNSKAFSHGHPTILPGFEYTGQPIMITEFGGVKVEEQGAEGWGYGDAAADYDEMLERIERLVQVIIDEPEICGFCYTQLTDVEQEVNGLMTYDRRLKVKPEKLQAIFQKTR